jgi:cell division protein FtsI (penicillin-binding protein 3)/stage V sporulation protein D (sporulation-specific penicillin-binding protein)
VNFFAEVFSNIEHTIFKNTGDSGDVVTTLEPTVQQYVQDSLNTVMTTWKSDAAGAIVMNPKDGSIYAMAYTPTFDINQFGKVEDVKRFSNPLVENVFEFGSVVKPLVMAGALDAGVVTSTTTYTDNGFVMVEGKKLNNFDKKGRGVASMQEVLTQSLNTGMVFVEQKMGKDTFRKYMTSYDLGVKTNIDLPNETQGLTANLKSPRNLEYATAAFGQGIALTPVELIRAFGSLANGGVMVTPHLMKSINYSEGGSEDFKGETKKTELKPETIPVITKMLTTIVDTGIGEGQYKLEHYSIAAKTGTAQIALPSGGGYYTDRNLHSLLGFFPAYNPEFVMLFFTVNPKGAGSDFAAGTLAKPYMDTVKFLLNYYEVPPDR